MLSIVSMRGALLIGDVDACGIANISVIRNAGMLVQNRALTAQGMVAIQPMIVGIGFNRGPVRIIRVEAVPDFVIDCTIENLGRVAYSALKQVYEGFVEQASLDETGIPAANVVLPSRDDVMRVQSSRGQV